MTQTEILKGGFQKVGGVGRGLKKGTQKGGRRGRGRFKGRSPKMGVPEGEILQGGSRNGVPKKGVPKRGGSGGTPEMGFRGGRAVPGCGWRCRGAREPPGPAPIVSITPPPSLAYVRSGRGGAAVRSLTLQ